MEKTERDKYYWVHLSSVGEMNLAEKLIENILDRNKKIYLTVMTDTGMELFRKRYSGNPNIKGSYFPLDDYFLIKKTVNMLDIEKLIVIETEIWPNLYGIVSEKSEVIVVNGRISDKTFDKYKKIKGIISATLNKCSKILVQSDLDLYRYKELGVKEGILKVYPNLKYSINYPVLDTEQKKELKERIKINGRKLITAGSTREGEEKILIDIFKKINEAEKYQMILVPRHIQRTEEVAALCKGLDFSLYSENKKTEIIIVDKMGVLREMYQISDLVFVGGTLVGIGGHSILEPLYYGKVPIIGKYYSNIKDVAENAKLLNLVSIAETESELEDFFLDSDNSKNWETSEFFKKYNKIDEIIKEIL
ncbi:MAG: 3-deoxy-D-manno-octulosonic acid transferase [Fusobacteriales bacterium]|nr:3-deoxy-D-manno-octulosonic acid transferase [Fusobacteriales bacterium]